MEDKTVLLNEDCLVTMKKRMIPNHVKVDVVLTSPPYNTGRSTTNDYCLHNGESRYDTYIDDKNSQDYCEWIIELFNNFDRILSVNGVILWNVSYGTNITHVPASIGLLWRSIYSVIDRTNFEIADKIVWKKSTATPNNTSSNKLTRITEDIFVFCRKSEYQTFHANKRVVSTSKYNQKFYENICNFVQAKNNDELCPFNKATYSSELCKQLLNIYAPQDGKVYDPFMGTGTTAVACEELGLWCIGSEISQKQYEWSKERVQKCRESRKGDII